MNYVTETKKKYNEYVKNQLAKGCAAVGYFTWLETIYNEDETCPSIGRIKHAPGKNGKTSMP